MNEKKYNYCDLSIIVPCHNDGAFLLEAIDSIFKQEWMPSSYEIILVLDRPSPETLAAADSVRFLPNIVLVNNDLHGGASATRNLGVANSVGKWLIFLDGDDKLSSGSVRRRFDFVQNHQDVDWFYGNYSEIDTFGEYLRCSIYDTYSNLPLSIKMSLENLSSITFDKLSTDIFGARPCMIACVTIKRSAFIAENGFNIQLKQSEDTHLWIRLAAKYKFGFIPDVLAFYRKRDGSLTATRRVPFYWTRKTVENLIVLLQNTSYLDCLQEWGMSLCESDYWYCRNNLLYFDALKIDIYLIKVFPFRFYYYLRFLKDFIFLLFK